MCCEQVLLNDSHDQQHSQDRACYECHVLSQYSDDRMGEQVHVLDRWTIGSVQSTEKEKLGWREMFRQCAIFIPKLSSV